jgi:hypothetical protein
VHCLSAGPCGATWKRLTAAAAALTVERLGVVCLWARLVGGRGQAGGPPSRTAELLGVGLMIVGLYITTALIHATHAVCKASSGSLSSLCDGLLGLLDAPPRVRQVVASLALIVGVQLVLRHLAAAVPSFVKVGICCFAFLDVCRVAVASCGEHGCSRALRCVLWVTDRLNLCGGRQALQSRAIPRQVVSPAQCRRSSDSGEEAPQKGVR